VARGRVGSEWSLAGARRGPRRVQDLGVQPRPLSYTIAFLPPIFGGTIALA